MLLPSTLDISISYPFLPYSITSRSPSFSLPSYPILPFQSPLPFFIGNNLAFLIFPSSSFFQIIHPHSYPGQSPPNCMLYSPHPIQLILFPHVSIPTDPHPLHPSSVQFSVFFTLSFFNSVPSPSQITFTRLLTPPISFYLIFSFASSLLSPLHSVILSIHLCCLSSPSTLL